MGPTEFLEKIYAESMELVGSDDVIKSDLDKSILSHLDEILKSNAQQPDTLHTLKRKDPLWIGMD